MGNELVEKIRQEIEALNPLGIALQIELTAYNIMELLIELEKDSEYSTIAGRAYKNLGYTIDKEVLRAIKAEIEANKKNAAKVRQTEYYNAAHKAVDQIKFDLTLLINADF